MDTPDSASPAPGTPEPTTPLNADEQARLRRERRRAKVGQGADRLKKITQTQKGPGFDELYSEDALKKSTTTTTNTTGSTEPPELRTSDHYYEPDATFRPPPPAPSSLNPTNLSTAANAINNGVYTPSEAQQQQAELQQLMMNHPLFAGGVGGTGSNPSQPQSGQDPFMDLLQQMMSGQQPGGEGGAFPGFPGMPTNISGGPDGAPQMQQVQVQQDPYAKWWRVVHTVCAVGLGVYAVLQMSWSAYGSEGRFTGSKKMRILSEQDSVLPIFWYFVTMELLLQSTRFVLEQGRPPPGSMLSVIGSHLPPPFGKYLLTLARYSVIWTTIWRDFLTILFVWGLCSWWVS